jgi:hypothetical protein
MQCIVVPQNVSILSKEKIVGITNIESGTNIHEVADGIYRISTPLPPTFIPGGFSFNQYLIVDDEPLLFHTGPRKMFPLVREAVQSVMPVEKLRFVAFSHFEQDECGSLNDWLAAAPEAIPVCSKIAAMTSINDLAERAPKVLVDGETLSLGSHVVRWFDTPHLPHGWECGYMMEQRTRTLQTYLVRVRRREAVSTTFRTLETPARCWRGLPLRSRPRLPACTAVPGGATEQVCSELSLISLIERGKRLRSVWQSKF